MPERSVLEPRRDECGYEQQHSSDQRNHELLATAGLGWTQHHGKEHHRDAECEKLRLDHVIGACRMRKLH